MTNFFGITLTLAILLKIDPALAVDENKARELLSRVASSQDLSAGAQLLDLVKQAGWQDLGLLGDCVDTLNEFAFNLPRGSAENNFRGQVMDLRRTNIEQQKLTAEDFVKRMGKARVSYQSFEGILFKASPDPGARIKIIELMQRSLAGEDNPLNSILPGPDALSGDYAASWEQRPLHLAGYRMLAPEWKIIGMIELMSKLDSSPEVRQSAANFMAEWERLLANKPTGLGTDFDYVWDGIVDDYRQRTPVFVASMKQALLYDKKPILRVDNNSELFRTLFGGIDSVCRSAAGLVGVPETMPHYLDVLLLPELRALLN